MYEILSVIIASLAPVSELRGAIPLGIALGLTPEIVIPLAFIFNCLVFFPIFFALNFFYERFFIRFRTVRRFVDRAHRKGKPYIEKYGIPGLIVFVGIPLPVTGAWTGTIIAWLFDLEWKRSFLAVCIGVLIATIIVSAIVLGALGGFNYFIKPAIS